MSPKVYLQTLGCAKNQVDSEVMLGLLVRAGAEIVLDPAAADVCVVNTCGFIGPAKEESIGAILDLARCKEGDPGKRLVVAGCLAQRYAKQLRRALPEADAFVGPGEFDRLLEVIAAGHTPDASPAGGGVRFGPDAVLPRLRTGPFFSAYLKISEGCDHRCAFCAIPMIRGRYRSRLPDSILAEVEQLAAEGVVELNLVAQDLTAYGRDLRHGVTLATILGQLARVPGIRWIRLLYGHPASVDVSLLQVIAAEERICRYLDLPLQHISSGVLRRMRRGTGGRAVRELLARIRAAVPGIALRTSLVVGFPGETERDFLELLAFVREARFERAGVFEYSPEDGTVAEKFPGRVPQATVKRRYHCLMKAQAEVARAVNRSLVGTMQEVLVCGEDEAGRLYGRLGTQAPEVDGVVYLSGLAAAGEIVPVRVVGAGTYDLQGQVATPVDTLAERL